MQWRTRWRKPRSRLRRRTLRSAPSLPTLPVRRFRLFARGGFVVLVASLEFPFEGIFCVYSHCGAHVASPPPTPLSGRRAVVAFALRRNADPSRTRGCQPQHRYALGDSVGVMRWLCLLAVLDYLRVHLPNACRRGGCIRSHLIALLLHFILQPLRPARQ